MAIDITHERNFIQGILIENVAKELGPQWPSNRQWVQSKDSFSKILEAEGMVVERIELLDNMASQPVLEFGVEAADQQLEFISKSPFVLNVQWADEELERARQLFRREWEGIAEDGKVKIIDALYLYLARKV
ncbi:hypothetical protein SUNI508_10589 [Seiridium unicorne]|uniref:Uncharacterized protein n=1 Tax=Seiridium unicorne TaxID=138068 RepID=A0ABR2UL89_9PEZI